MTNDFLQIPALLHDAQLSGVDWEPQLGSLRLSFVCLRRGLDGSSLDDSTVDLKLDSVQQIAVYYAPSNVDVRPSEFAIETRLKRDDLGDWPYPPVEAFLAINSLQAEFEMATSCVTDWLAGEPSSTGDDQAPWRLHLSFEQRNCGNHAAKIGILIACEAIQPTSGSVPLDMDEWQQQYDAWWRGWREHWSAKESGEAESDESAIEDTFIPAGHDPPPDLAYAPPQQPPFLVEGTDAPLELLQPIEDLHVGLHQRDWLKLASAYPNLDRSQAERAAQLQQQYLGYEFGRWTFVRQIDSWWRKGAERGS